MNLINGEIKKKKIIKSPNDKCEYYYNMLPNGLRYILISNKEFDKSAVALDVYIGAADDPKEYQGLAHCLEHVIFLGTKKYPIASSFDDFLNYNSGSSNANTSLDHTNYHYEISHEQLENSIDRFSQFFIQPLFSEELISKELNAIDSEFRLDIRDDSNKLLSLYLFEGYKDSNFNTFMTGNLDTLQKNEIRDKVIEFFNNKYDSKLMSLCICSNKDLKELDNYVIRYFSNIKSNPNYKRINNSILYDERNLGFFYKVIPIKDISNLKFIWTINKSYNSYYKSEPYNYVISVLGHEGKYSLTAYLKSKGYIYSLLVSYNTFYDYFTKITLTVKLTNEGYNNINTIIEIILTYVNYLQREDINKDFFEELKRISEINFFLDEQYDPIDLCEDISSSLTLTKLDEDIYIKSKLEEYKPELIKEILNSMTTENLNIYLMSSKLKENKEEGKYNIESIYGTQYIKNKVNFFSFIKQINNDLAYPQLNPFIPKNLKMINIDNLTDFIIPKKMVNDAQRIIWYKPNIKYNMPKVYLSAKAYISNLNIGLNSYLIYSDILFKLLLDELSELIYLGEASENSINFDVSVSSLLIDIEGYSDMINNYLKEYFNNIKKIINITSIKDINIKLLTLLERKMKKINNFHLAKVREQTEAKFRKILTENNIDNRLIICENFKKNLENNIIPEEFFIFMKNLLKKVKYEWLIEGNILYNEAESIILNVENSLNELFGSMNQNKNGKELLSINEIRKQRVIDIPFNKIYRFNFSSKDKENESSTILIYFQIGNFNYNKNDIFNQQKYRDYIKYKSLLFIINSIFSESFYDDLRTQQQIGYDVYTQNDDQYGILGFLLFVSSAKFNPDQIVDKINKFLINKNILNPNNFTDEDFETYKKSIVNQLNQKPLNLGEEFSRDISYMTDRTYIFDQRQDFINYINDSMTKQDVVNFFSEYIYYKSKRLEIALYNSKKVNIEMDIENECIDSNEDILPSYKNATIEIIHNIDDFHRYTKYFDIEIY